MSIMLFVTFNINSIRAHIHQLDFIIKKYNPDVIALQETKVHDDFFPIDTINTLGYNSYFCGQKSYNGVSFISKKKISIINKGFPLKYIPNFKTRLIYGIIDTKIGLIHLLNVYCPQGDNRQNKEKYIEKQKFYKNLKCYLSEFIFKKSFVVVMGDMNVCQSSFDIGLEDKIKQRWIRIGKCSFLPEEINWLNELKLIGFIDVYRFLHPNINDRFSWFDYRRKNFNMNRGLRLDLILSSCTLLLYVHSSGIDYQIRNMNKPSDHAPVWVKFNI